MKKPIFLLLFFCIVLAGPASAQFFVEEGKVTLSVSGGERINNAININNTSPETLDLRIYWEDFEYVPPYDGAKKFMPAGTGKGSASEWIRFSPQDLKLPPFGRQKVEYTINVPPQVEGGHYGVLFIEKSSDPLKDSTGVKIITRIGSIFFIEAKNKIKKAELLDIKAEGNDFIGSFSNSGNVVLIPQITYYIMDESGLAIDRGELPKLYVSPEAAGSWKLALPQDLKPARFTMVLNADLDEGDLVVKEVTFSKDSSGIVTVEKIQD